MLARAGGLLTDGADPDKILFVSHTRAAAAEIRERGKLKNVSTLHSLCYHELELTRQLTVTPAKMATFARDAKIEASGERDSELPGDQMLSVYQRSVARGTSPEEEYENSVRPGSYAHYEYVWRAYEAWKQEFGYYDFNDMLDKAAQMPLGKYEHVFVDEAQDLSPLQWRVVEAVTRDADTVTVAGDDDQAIFIWGGADPQGMQRWSEDNKATVSVLDQSYRVPREVHWLAQAVRGRIAGSVDKTYRPAPHDGLLVRHSSLELVDDHIFVGATILYRDLAGRAQIEHELDSRRITYTAGGQGRPTRYDSRYGRALRIVDKMRRGISIEEREMKLLLETLNYNAMARLTSQNAEWLFDKRPSEVLEAPIETLEYLDAVDVTRPAQVYLSTIHGAKGKEWNRVILLSQQSERVAREFVLNPDAEHRVMYVGITRAKHELHIAFGENQYDLWGEV